MRKILFLTLLTTMSFANMTTMKPKYLYKILSDRNWKATQARNALMLSADDDAFIHFSKEDQLDRIVNKYWADVGPYVILTINTELLQGDLVYEANPGGSAQYYHLYNGFIPFSAITESKEVGVVAPKNVLSLVEIGDPVLRKTSKPLSKEEILSPEIQMLIEQMKETMRAAPGVGLAAPQIGRDLNIAVIEDMDHGHLTAEQLKQRDRNPVPFHVIINPVLTPVGEETVDFFEGCLSIPKFMGIVPRAKSVKVNCLNEKGEPVTIHATGWYARILQHEIDHLNGKLYIDCAHIRTLMTEENFSKNWRGKSIQEIVDI
jgi:peptide deformylase